MECREQILSEDYADVFFEYNTISQLEETGYCYTIINDSFATLYIPLADLPEDYGIGFGYFDIPSCFGLMDIPSSEASGVSTLRNTPVLNLRGQNTLIGIIDTGIEYTHEAFLYEDGTSRVLSIWDQTIQEGTPPEGFRIGTNYTQEQINEALLSDDPLSIVPTTDEDGHGTFITGTAAGNENREANFTGIAPDAEIVIVKLKEAKAHLKEFFRIPPSAKAYQGNDIIQALSYLVSVSVGYQRPISICIGLGTSQGAHDDKGLMNSFINNIAKQDGTAITVAAGNEGNAGHHYSGKVISQSEPDTIELRVGQDEYGFMMELWGNTPSTFSIDILSPTGEYIPEIPARIRESREIRFILEETVVNVDYFLVATESGDQLILMRFRNPTEGIWRFRVYSSGNLDLSFDAWLPIEEFVSENTFFTQANPDTTITRPGNASVPMTVTAYNVSNNSLYLRASRGYTRTGDIKPDFAAPGVNIIGPTLNNGYMTASGTSVSAAHTAGIAALFLEWGIVLGMYPQMSTVEIKNLLIRGAIRDPQVVYPNKSWGYGIINIYNSFLYLRGEIL